MIQISADATKRFFGIEGNLWFTKTGLYSATPVACAKRTSELVKTYGGVQEVVDACCGIGADLAAFAKDFNAVGYEVDPVTAQVAERNMRAMDLPAKVHCADFLDAVQEMKTDCIYLDLPWGGVDYRTKRVNLVLTHAHKGDLVPNGTPREYHLHEIIGEHNGRAELFVAKVPTNYDTAHLLALERQKLFRGVNVIPINRKAGKKGYVAYNIVVLSKKRRNVPAGRWERPISWRGYKDLMAKLE